MATDAVQLPVLWQLELSHFNEKVRWALDHKGIPHVRRSLLPGQHRLVAKRLTGDSITTPVLTLNGSSIGDSTQIIAALEERWPEPALYPTEAADRRRALELEDFFDEQLGPHIRRAIYWDLIDHPKQLLPLFTHGQPLAKRLLFRAVFPLLRFGMRRDLNIREAPSERSRAATFAALDRLEAEIGPSGYLVGDRFTVADLTAASLFYPLAMPPEFPYPLISDPPAGVVAVLEETAERPGIKWVGEMYRRHRGVSAERAG